MTRTKVASSRPQATGTTPVGRRASRASRKALVLPVAMLLAMAPAAPALAAESSGTSNYNQSPTTPKEKPAAGTSPSKSKSMASKETAPTSSKAHTTESTLPRTGLDLRWTVGMGLLLIVAGFSIVGLQRRERRDGGD
jgi:LPXTG-motif cell wall-anchored protein